MFSQIGETIFEHEVVAKTSDFNMGLEVEMHRADSQGRISSDPTPAGISLNSPWVTKDFTETMTEVVTPAASNSLDAIHYLYSIQNALRAALAPGEVLWPLSMPPAFTDASKIELAQTTPEKHAYLERVLENMGRVNKGLPCGAHISLSIDDHVVDIIWEQNGGRFASKAALKNHLYLLLAQGFVRYRWVLTYLFGASPVAEAGFFDPEDDQPTGPIRCLRQSHYGFDMRFKGDYSTIPNYVGRIETGVANGEIIDEAQFHGAIRLKTSGDLTDMEENGVSYIELRMLDLDPTSTTGVKLDTLRLLRIMASYFIMTPGMQTKDVSATIQRANEINEEVATEDPTTHSQYEIAGKNFLNRLFQFANQIQLGPEYLETLETMMDRFDNPANTISGQLVAHLENGSLLPYMTKRAAHYQDGALMAMRTFNGFADMETPLSAEDLKNNLFRGSYEPSGLVE